MGMYDNVRYEGDDYQTKDFDCTLSDYSIEYGRLFVLSCEPTSKKDIHYHGTLNFYNGSVEYNAKFTDGVLVEITEVSDDL